MCVCVCVCLPWGIVKQTHHILCQHQPHHTYKEMTDLSLSPTHIHKHAHTHMRRYIHTHQHLHTPVWSLNTFLSALEQPVRQATGKIMLFSLLGKGFEMCYIINIWLEDVSLSHFSPILSEYVKCHFWHTTCNIYLFTMNTLLYAQYVVCQQNVSLYILMHFGHMNCILEEVNDRKWLIERWSKTSQVKGK